MDTPNRAGRGWAWASTLGEFVAESPEVILESLEAFVSDATGEQRRAWRDSVRILREEGAVVLRSHPPAAGHGTVLEYELPREGGRRPDVLVLQNGAVVVLEFKGADRPRRADLDQVRSYARDLSHYHSECRELRVVPVLVIGGVDGRRVTIDGTHVVTGVGLGPLLLEIGREHPGGPVDSVRWLAGEYAPLPTLVAAARLLFERLPLPHIRRARSAGVPDTVELCLRIARDAGGEGRRHLTLLTGVPGAGKTLVGLQVVHGAVPADPKETDRAANGAPATFLSGNGPLIQVLQNALGSKTFVQDMHRYIREYGLLHPERVPPEHVIVFDEAQRAWDAAKIEDFYAKKNLGLPPAALRRSEPGMLVESADRLPGWAMVLALVGGGQEIHNGEEGGMELWAEAIVRSDEDWVVHGPPGLGSLFAGSGREYRVHPELDLDTTLRSHAASDLHRWASLLLDDGDVAGAAAVAARLREEAFPIYATRDLSRARDYVRARFRGEPLRRYGILASSKSRALPPYGLDSGFQATRRIPVGPWFNAPPDDPRSCCRLDTVVTEFQAQGLELDLPIVAWGEDFLWTDGAWRMKPVRRQALVRDPMRLRTNAYRVLLTRGREGLVLFVPPEPRFDSTFATLVRAGAKDAAAPAAGLGRVAESG